MFTIGRAYLAAGRFDDARTRLRAALDLQPARGTWRRALHAATGVFAAAATAGLAERGVMTTDGTLTAGPVEGGGWSVRATLHARIESAVPA